MIYSRESEDGLHLAEVLYRVDGQEYPMRRVLYSIWPVETDGRCVVLWELQRDGSRQRLLIPFDRLIRQTAPPLWLRLRHLWRYGSWYPASYIRVAAGARGPNWARWRWRAWNPPKGATP